MSDVHEPRQDPTTLLFIFQFKNPLILLLLASALVSVLTKKYEDAISIAVVSAPHGSHRSWGTVPPPIPDLAPEVLLSLCLFLLCKEKKLGCKKKKKSRKHSIKDGQEVSMFL